MTLTKRFTPLVLALTLLIAPTLALAKTGKLAKAIKRSVATAPVKPQSGCDQSCYQEFFDAIDNCNGLHYIDEGLYADCVSQAQQNLRICQVFCSIGRILGKAQPKNAVRTVVRLSE